MRYQTSITWNAERRKLVVGYRIVKQSICPIVLVPSSSPLAAPKGRYTNTSLRRTTKACPRHVGAPGRLHIRRHFKPIFFFGLGHNWRTVLRACAQNADCFRVSYFACGNMSLPAPYFRLQSCAAYRRFDQRRTSYTKVVP